MKRFFVFIIVALVLLIAAGCALPPPMEDDDSAAGTVSMEVEAVWYRGKADTRLIMYRVNRIYVGRTQRMSATIDGVTFRVGRDYAVYTLQAADAVRGVYIRWQK